MELDGVKKGTSWLVCLLADSNYSNYYTRDFIMVTSTVVPGVMVTAVQPLRIATRCM